ncbi:alpha/beta fold hydrolase [Nonomuraea endophytica]|uniref:Pimeloyl-ACP methyl ester carboxylesterase n=1 Tax=Nonomuraea endophytica TaxID=714136 RepID=A0A7W8ED56_9ACTN|nr:alpha/beta hydrolase [Nonomuraea endophytica]MBB5075038.1 pimeloyl-ACP methyl ester carboxylesterase [Nonomuraea endophytica]
MTSTTMFTADDGTALARHEFGQGEPLVCLPGGPMSASSYLGDLGGLSADRRLVMLDLRGTGGSAVPEDTSTYRCDRLVPDVEALRRHLGLERLDLLAHSAGANLAVLYTAGHPERVRSLTLITPSVFAVGLMPSGEQRRAFAMLRKDEPWFAGAHAALVNITEGRGGPDDWPAIAPFSWGRWDEAARARVVAEDALRNDDAARVYGRDAFDPPSTRAALGDFEGPVRLLAGEYDMGAMPEVVREMAGLFPRGVMAVQQGAGHFPWLDDPQAFLRFMRES